MARWKICSHICILEEEEGNNITEERIRILSDFSAKILYLLSILTYLEVCFYTNSLIGSQASQVYR